jgi:hypothetical protein
MRKRGRVASEFFPLGNFVANPRALPTRVTPLPRLLSQTPWFIATVFFCARTHSGLSKLDFAWGGRQLTSYALAGTSIAREFSCPTCLLCLPP